MPVGSDLAVSEPFSLLTNGIIILVASGNLYSTPVSVGEHQHSAGPESSKESK